MAVQLLRRLFPSSPPLWPEGDPLPCHVEFVEEQSGIEAEFPTLLGFPCHQIGLLLIVTRLGNVNIDLGLGLITGFI
jgi:hypothetical protein